MISLETGKTEEALQFARKLEQQFAPDPQAYGKLIEAEAQIKRHDYRGAVHTFQEAQKIADTWLGRFGLGRAYLAAGAFTDADTELDACLKRRGAELALFRAGLLLSGPYPRRFAKPRCSGGVPELPQVPREQCERRIGG
jgi:hypothetical protein